MELETRIECFEYVTALEISSKMRAPTERDKLGKEESPELHHLVIGARLHLIPRWCLVSI